MTDEPQPNAIIPHPTQHVTHLTAAGQAANAAAARHVFAAHRQRITPATASAQRGDLGQFAVALADVAGVMLDGAALLDDPAAWAGVTWGLVATYRTWLGEQGFATASINRKLATVKTYAELAYHAGTLPEAELLRIRTLAGYHGTQARNLDAQRSTMRRSAKKADWTRITPQQAQHLKTMHDPSTPVGRRNALLLCVLIDHGLRVSEVAALDVTAIDLAHNTLVAYRQKTHETTTHYLEPATRKAAQTYFTHDAPPPGPLFPPATRTGQMQHGRRLSIRGIRQIVAALGAQLGIAQLSPHDLRHYGALARAQRGIDSLDIAEWGNWKSLTMVQRYRGAAQVANARAMLNEDASNDAVSG